MVLIGIVMEGVSAYLYYLAFKSDVCKNGIELQENLYKSVLTTFQEHVDFPDITTYSYVCNALATRGGIYDGTFGACIPLLANTILLQSWPKGITMETDFFSYEENNQNAIYFMIEGMVLTAMALLIFFFKLTIPRNTDFCLMGIDIFFSILMLGVIFLGQDLVSNWTGSIKDLETPASMLYSCAKACNDGFYAERHINDDIYEFRISNQTVPRCHYNNVELARNSLLATPICFFGSRLVRSCINKWYNRDNRDNRDKRKEEFDRLGEVSNYNYMKEHMRHPSTF